MAVREPPREKRTDISCWRWAARARSNATMFVQAMKKQRNGTVQNPEGSPHTANRHFLEWFDSHAQVRICFWKCDAKLFLHCRQVCARLLKRHAGLESPNPQVPCPLPALRNRLIHRDGRPEVDIAVRKQKGHRHNSHDGRRMPIDAQLPSESVWIGVEATPPEAVAD